MSRVKAVFFDWVGTVARPEPDRHMGVYLVAKELGYELPLDKLSKSLYRAENRVTDGVPGVWWEGKDEAPFLGWWDVVLEGMNIEVPPESRIEITRRVSQMVKKLKWVLYDDVLPVVEELKERGVILGVISNMYTGRGLLDRFLDIAVTIKDVGVGKPDPAIFSAALEQAKVTAGDSIYIGDQYESDVVGARGVGMQPLLIDRYGVVTDVLDCPVIHSFREVPDFV